MSKNQKNVLAAISAVLIVGTLASPGYGFTSVEGSEGLGFNLWAICVYGFGSYFIYKALKKEKEEPKKEEKKEEKKG